MANSRSVVRCRKQFALASLQAHIVHGDAVDTSVAWTGLEDKLQQGIEGKGKKRAILGREHFRMDLVLVR